MIIIRSTLENPSKHGSKRRNSRLWTSLLKALICCPLKFFRGILKLTVHAREPTNILHMREFCMEKWSKMLISETGWQLHLRLQEVISGKRFNTSFWFHGCTCFYIVHHYMFWYFCWINYWNCILLCWIKIKFKCVEKVIYLFTWLYTLSETSLYFHWCLHNQVEIRWKQTQCTISLVYCILYMADSNVYQMLNQTECIIGENS